MRKRFARSQQAFKRNQQQINQGGEPMAIASEPRAGEMMKLRRREALEYRLIFFLSFAFFLVAVLVARLVPWSQKARPGFKGNRSIISEARAAAHTCIPFAFMR
jgi:hypothetical protein